MTDWIKVEDELPPDTESFKDGMHYHATVIGWFPNFYRHNARETSLWTCKGIEDRWMVSAGGSYGKAKEPPTHWTPMLKGPT